MSIADKLKVNEVRERLFNHPLFDVEPEDFSIQSANFLLEQYWHPMHYFPTFLAQLSANSPDLAFSCGIANILDEELGEGVFRRAHENIFLESFGMLGFDQNRLKSTSATTTTSQLIDCYKEGNKDFLVGLGGLYATESTDLAIVSGMGKVLQYATQSTKTNNWIAIHLKQEPNHVKQTDTALDSLSPSDESKVIENAEKMWLCWIAFFNETLALVEKERQSNLQPQTT